MPTYLKPTINGNCGKDKSFWGGRDVECTPTQPSSPITWATQHGENALYMRSAPFPFPHVLWCTKHVLSHVMTCQAHPAPYMFYRGREYEAPDAFQALGIRHATYMRTCAHTKTFSLYISIVHIEKICT